MIDAPTKHGSRKYPPQEVPKSLQMDLFGRFITNDEVEVSNTVELWESIPKYFFTPHLMKRLRTSNGHADPYEWEFTNRGIPCKIVVHPVLIKQDDDTYKAFFPGATEELVEEALKKILCDQRYGLHDKKNAETWVRFTLRMIQKQLSTRNRDRNINRIKQALEIMSRCILVYSQNGKHVWSGAILQDLVTVGRNDYIADGSSQHVARLPAFITRSINNLEFRQFNINRLMSCDEQLTRWIYKRLINRYKQASNLHDYHFMYSSIVESGHLQQSSGRDNRKKVISCLREAIRQKVISRFETEVKKDGAKVIDVKYTVHPTIDFIREQKAANKRRTEHKDILSGLSGQHKSSLVNA